MALTLNHYSIRTAELEACRQFYTEVVGLRVGPRPDFPFPGIWLYEGDTSVAANAVVHVIGVDPTAAAGLEGYLGARDAASLQGTGVVDHIAFYAIGLPAMRQNLQRLGVDARERTVPGLGLHQLFLTDPDGVVIEFNYPVAEA